jgi:hypothetical protein
MIALTDKQLETVMAAAAGLSPARRGTLAIVWPPWPAFRRR